MKEYLVDCSWKRVGTLRIKANSIEEARGIAYDMTSLPQRSDYLEDSFVIDEIKECENT